MPLCFIHNLSFSHWNLWEVEKRCPYHGKGHTRVADTSVKQSQNGYSDCCAGLKVRLAGASCWPEPLRLSVTPFCVATAVAFISSQLQTNTLWVMLLHFCGGSKLAFLMDKTNTTRAGDASAPLCLRHIKTRVFVCVCLCCLYLWEHMCVHRGFDKRSWEV